VIANGRKEILAEHDTETNQTETIRNTEALPTVGSNPNSMSLIVWDSEGN
jgi:hypothetical protein